MKRALVVSIASVLVLSAGISGAIVNGERVTDAEFEAEFAWAVVVARKDSQQLCGGALIAERWVITAAHCANKDRYVLLGGANRYTADTIEIVRSIRHPKFSAKDFRYDIGLLELAEPASTRQIKLASQAETERLLMPGSPAIIAGWGKTATNNSPVSRLVAARISMEELVAHPTQFAFSSRSGPCSNDSGGPLTMTNSTGSLILVGIASRTDGNLCSKNGGLSIYSRVDAADAFIHRFLTAPKENSGASQ